ncbi:carboxypeptidase-like regulatory domain-containing protein [Tenacibaculum aestuariivivum]|uniref:carboxypeptidase-like regulatory domain-containing protein n=1 Tax=Tenacibaculum aestuariivivum TaxID=2006131 RepID=UPI003AB2909F
MKKLLLFVLVLLSFLKIQSQENRTFLYGEVKDKIGVLFKANVINLNTKQGTFTNKNGEFKILAKLNDSLKISFVGYKPKVFVVKINYFGIQKNTFNLLKIIYKLDEVHLKKHNLLGFLTSDSKNINSKRKINAKTLNLPYAETKKLTPAERTLQTAMGGSKPFTIGIANVVSLDYILNSVSGKIKKLRKLKTIETLEIKVAKIKNTYATFIIKEYYIKESDLYRFIYFCTTDKKFNHIYNSNEINMILFLKNKAEVFKKLNSNNYN